MFGKFIASVWKPVRFRIASQNIQQQLRQKLPYVMIFYFHFENIWKKKTEGRAVDFIWESQSRKLYKYANSLILIHIQHLTSSLNGFRGIF